MIRRNEKAVLFLKKKNQKNFCSLGDVETSFVTKNKSPLASFISETEALSFSNGYTLTELLIVLAIMGLMAALAPPMLTGSQHRFQTKSGIYRLAARLDAAHDQAVDTRTTAQVQLPSQGFVSFFPDGSATGMTLQQSGMTLSVAPISGTVTLREQ